MRRRKQLQNWRVKKINNSSWAKRGFARLNTSDEHLFSMVNNELNKRMMTKLKIDKVIRNEK
jgi:hypothetical protein